MNRTCVISQPTFLSWPGRFDLADQGDVMTIQDDVHAERFSPFIQYAGAIGLIFRLFTDLSTRPE